MTFSDVPIGENFWYRGDTYCRISETQAQDVIHGNTEDFANDMQEEIDGICKRNYEEHE